MANDSEFVDGAAKLSRRIATITERLALPPMIAEIGQLLLRRTMDRFDREIDPDGHPWKPLESSTLKRRDYAGAGKKMLVRTKLMRNSIQIIKGGLNATFTNTGAGLRIGIDSSAVDERGEHVSVYARIQNRERRFLGVGRLDVKAVDGLLRRAGERALEE